ncbi:MAG: tetratricopeptide repeat protein [Rickettsiaceae bacterium]|nr:tetratricopeptide repeat protein [Rickettsiaceae bacterium]
MSKSRMKAGCMSTPTKDTRSIINNRVMDLESRVSDKSIKITSLGPDTPHYLFNEAGEIYMEIAQLYEIGKLDNEKKQTYWKHAEYFFNKAILNLHDDEVFLSNTKSRYFANLAAAISARDITNTEAEDLCIESIGERQNGLAYETLGHIYHNKKTFEEALICFKNAMEFDPEYASKHSLILMYHQARMLASMGRKEEALEIFNDAINRSENNLTIENLITLKNLKQSEISETLSKIANTAKCSKDNGDDVIHDVVSNIRYPNMDKGSSLDNIQKLKECRINSISAKNGGENSIELKNTISELENRSPNKKTEKNEIKSDLYKFNMYKQIRSDLCSIFSASQTMSTHMIQARESQTNMGNLVKIVHHLKDMTAGPVKIGLHLIGVALNSVDENERETRIQNFKDVAIDLKEMEDFAEILARKIIMENIAPPEKNIAAEVIKIGLEISSTGHLPYKKLTNSLKFTANIKNLKEKKELIKKGKSDGIVLSQMIAELIFSGKLKDIDEIDEKVNLTVALLKLNGNDLTIDSTLENDAVKFSSNIFGELKSTIEAEHYIWKNKLQLEIKFVEYLSLSIQKYALHLLESSDFDTEILSALVANEEFIIKGHRKYMFWQNKAKISEIFLKSKEYFDEMVQTIANNFASLDPTNIASEEEEAEEEKRDDYTTNNIVNEDEKEDEKEDDNTENLKNIATTTSEPLSPSVHEADLTQINPKIEHKHPSLSIDTGAIEQEVKDNMNYYPSSGSSSSDTAAFMGEDPDY